jgi:hypothetical protein
MPNRNLTAAELVVARRILDSVRAQIAAAAGIYKELIYDERGKPTKRNKLKVTKRLEQEGICPDCKNPLPEKYCVLDRRSASKGYTSENTDLICPTCDHARQCSRGYA